MFKISGSAEKNIISYSKNVKMKVSITNCGSNKLNKKLKFISIRGYPDN